MINECRAVGGMGICRGMESTPLVPVFAINPRDFTLDSNPGHSGGKLVLWYVTDCHFIYLQRNMSPTMLWRVIFIGFIDHYKSYYKEHVDISTLYSSLLYICVLKSITVSTICFLATDFNIISITVSVKYSTHKVFSSQSDCQLNS
jgi:hypothetical protein